MCAVLVGVVYPAASQQAIRATAMRFFVFLCASGVTWLLMFAVATERFFKQPGKFI